MYSVYATFDFGIVISYSAISVLKQMVEKKDCTLETCAIPLYNFGFSIPVTAEDSGMLAAIKSQIGNMIKKI